MTSISIHNLDGDRFGLEVSSGPMTHKVALTGTELMALRDGIRETLEGVGQ